jgi:hypothetical protein
MPLLSDNLLLGPNVVLGAGETPASGLVTEGILNSLSPWNDPDGHWANLNAAMAAMLEPIASLVLDVGSPDEPASYQPGWSVLLDPDQCPAQYIPYGAQFVGVFIAPGTPEAEARAIWKARSGWWRGTLQAIQSAVELAQATPDPTRYAIQERMGPLGPDAYHFMVAVDYTSLTTQGDTTQLVANITAIKPAGVQFTVTSLAAPLLSQYTRLLENVTVDLNVDQLSDVT